MRAVAVVLAVLCVALVAFAAPAAVQSGCQSLPMRVPVLSWTTDSRVQFDLGIVNEQRQLEDVFRSVGNPKSNKHGILTGHPETLLVVVHDSLRADELARYSGAHEAHSDGGALRELRSAVDGAPHSNTQLSFMPSERSLAWFLRHEWARGAAWHGARVLIGVEGSPEPVRTEHGVIVAPLSELPALMEQHEVARNGQLDFVVALLAGDEACGADPAATRARLARQDALLPPLLRAAGSAAVLFTGSRAAGPASGVAAPRVLLSVPPVLGSAAPNGTNVTATYMTAPVAAGLATAGLGLLVVMIGFCCLFTLSTQSKFEGPDKPLAGAGGIIVPQ